MECYHPITKTFEERYVCCLRCGRRLRDIKREEEAKLRAMESTLYKYIMQDATAVNWQEITNIVATGTTTTTTNNNITWETLANAIPDAV